VNIACRAIDIGRRSVRGICPDSRKSVDPDTPNVRYSVIIHVFIANIKGKSTKKRANNSRKWCCDRIQLAEINQTNNRALKNIQTTASSLLFLDKHGNIGYNKRNGAQARSEISATARRREGI
jgi:hypothetical protein